jgi:hypothetical protein
MRSISRSIFNLAMINPSFLCLLIVSLLTLFPPSTAADSLALPLNIDIYTFSADNLRILADHRIVSRILQNTLDSYAWSYDKGTVKYYFNYRLIDMRNPQEFIGKYADFIRKQPKMDGESIHLVRESEVFSNIHQILTNHADVSASFSSYSIIIVPRTFSSQLPLHKFFDEAGNELAKIQPMRGLGFGFVDLSAYSKALSIPNSKLNDVMMFIAGVSEAVKLHLTPQTAVSDFVLSSTNIFLPIVSLRRLNLSTIDDQKQAVYSIPDVKSLDDWYTSNLIDVATVSMASAHHYIDEHPQIAVAIASSITRKGNLVVTNSRLLANNIKEAGDYFCEQLLDHSGKRSDIEYSLAYDNENIRLYKEKLHKEFSAVKDENKATQPSNIKKLFKTFKSKQSAESIEDLLWDKHLKIAHRKHVIIPVFLVSNIRSFSASNQISSRFETGSAISVIDDTVLVLDDSSSQQGVSGLVGAGILEALSGIRLRANERSVVFESREPAANRSALAWEAKRSGKP